MAEHGTLAQQLLATLVQRVLPIPLWPRHQAVTCSHRAAAGAGMGGKTGKVVSGPEPACVLCLDGMSVQPLLRRAYHHYVLLHH